MKRLYVKKGQNPNSADHLKARLKNGSVLDPETGCWIWKKHLNNQGYGKLTVAKKMVYAHRLSYELFVGSLGPLQALHRCDNPACINPQHLFAGTRSCPGTSNGSAKLHDEQVRAIRSRLQQGETQRSIAAEFGVTQSLVSLIYRRRLWAHL